MEKESANYEFTTNERGEVEATRADHDFLHVSTDAIYNARTGQGLVGSVKHRCSVGLLKPIIIE